MPYWIDTPAEEKAWKKAKSIVSRQRSKKESEFTNRDWGLVTHIAKSILKASVSASTMDEGLMFALANVDTIISTQAKKTRRSVDASLPSREMVSGLSRLADVTSKLIAAYRSQDVTVLDMDLLRKIEETAEVLDNLMPEKTK